MPENTKSFHVVFFDIGATLGIVSTAGQELTLEVFPGVAAIIGELNKGPVRLGIVSRIGDFAPAAVDQMLRACGLFDFFDTNLLHYISGDTPKDKAEFEKALAKTGDTTAGSAIFIGEDPQERTQAALAGMRVGARPADALAMLEHGHLQYMKIDVLAAFQDKPWQQELLRYELEPLYVTGTNGSIVYAIASPENIERLNQPSSWFRATPLGETDAPFTTDLYLLKDVPPPPAGFTGTLENYAPGFEGDDSKKWVVDKTQEAGIDVVFVALPVGYSIEDYHFENIRHHGHNLKLTPPSKTLLAPVQPASDALVNSLGPAGFLTTVAGFDADEKNIIQSKINDAVIRQHIERYSSTPIASRHIHHPGNKVAVNLLVQDLRSSIGNQLVTTDRFLHEGKMLENVIAEIPGQMAETVIICAHLDSTGANEAGYDPKRDDAPGADDDASGMAAVLAAVEAMKELIKIKGKPKRTIRFALFNAEEHGLVGSRAYATRQADNASSILGVLQMDMIGYDRIAPANWEVHFGYSANSEVQKRSGILAAIVKEAAAEIAPDFPVPQIIPLTLSEPDPADRRSDHASFQMVGYAACVISEDFFPGPGNADANPQYHHPGDVLSELNITYATNIARIVTASAWSLISKDLFSEINTVNLNLKDMSKNYDSRNFSFNKISRQTGSSVGANVENLIKENLTVNLSQGTGQQLNINSMTGMPRSLNDNTSDQSQPIIQRAIKFVQNQLSGFSVAEPAEFVPDPLVFETSSGTKVVNLQQHYLGVPVFQMTRNVQFTAHGAVPQSEGDSIPQPTNMDIIPTTDLLKAVVLSVQNIRNVLRQAATEIPHDPFNLPPDNAETDGRTSSNFARPEPADINIDDYLPKYVYTFADAAQRSVIGWVKKNETSEAMPQPYPLGAFIAANLTIFYQGPDTRLGWEMLITLHDQSDQFRIIWPADEPSATAPLYRYQTASHIKGVGLVYRFSPRPDTQEPVEVSFPLELSSYPVARNLARPLADIQFPRDWCDTVDAFGNCTLATRGNTTSTFQGIRENGSVVYRPNDPVGDDQKILNIFYFCNYMHDFFYLLGFDEANGNFQKQNFTSSGIGGDAVRARAHPGVVNGTANMITPPDGASPIMNMGLVASTNRHTAFDADVVFHEFCHGVTNRLVGGRKDTSALEQIQSGGMGEGWGDYFALTIQNFDKNIQTERRVTGDWVTNRRSGIRAFPYGPRNAANEPDPAKRFPDSFGSIGTGRYNEEHNIGEIWCAALMHMNRMMGIRLNSYQFGHQIGWQIVVDALMLTRANPSFIDARNAIMKALDELKTSGRLNAVDHKKARRGAWEAFAEFGMGVSAFCPNATLDGIQEAFDLPDDL